MFEAVTSAADLTVMHAFVDREVIRGQSRERLDWLIQQGKVQVIDDADLLNRLVEAGDSEYVACQFYRRVMAACIECVDYPSHLPSPKGIYRSLLIREFETRSELLKELREIENQDLIGCHIGELKSAILIRIFQRIGADHILLFTSNDHAARDMVYRSTDDEIACASVIGSFVLLRDRGVPRVHAEEYLHQLVQGMDARTNRVVYLFEENGRQKHKMSTYQRVFDLIYENQASLLKNGSLFVRK
ncbi:hypothetical protein JJB07_04390 [Tumebacillus sp. ITR2]|uniref:Uncharacterized protein n=1 Tax=Tumebacillus amylolyticus TaxID=2801339 RepID=A0ABS1J6P2_9BACL|nr:hypothetical protein [Tumebacillus amylolyticus]MBL0385882.1 hypothetical protein [Tumebacillus amylolyticus]